MATILACVGLMAAVSAPSAGAAATASPSYAFLAEFGAGHVGFEPSGFASAARSRIGVDGEGRILFANENFGTVAIFAPDASSGGTFLTEFPTSNLPADIAVDTGNDALYYWENVCCSATPMIHRYLSDGQPTPTYTLDPSFEVPAATGLGFANPPGSGMAVDPVTHDLLVADPGAGAVQRYDSSGTLVASYPTPSMAPEWVAVAADGSVLAAEMNATKVERFAADGTLLNEIQVGGKVEALGVDRKTGVVVVGVGEQSVVSGTLGKSLVVFTLGGRRVAETTAPVAGGNLNVSIDPGSGRLYTTGKNTLYAFQPATSPGIEKPVISSVGPHSAHLSAEVDPGVDPGGNPGDPPPAGSFARFEYSADGGKTWVATPDQTLTAPGPTTIEADLTALLVNYPYLVRVKAGNALSTFSGEAVEFATPQTAPEVTTGNATDVTEVSVVLNGGINPAGMQTSYHFEYGLSTGYGSRIPVGIEGVAGGSRESRIFSRTIAGLSPGTTYHFRLVATNAMGVTAGADRTFTTATVGGIPKRGYEQVTPVDKQGNPIDPNVGFQAATDGSALAYINRGGKLSSPLSSYAMSLRGATNWQTGIDLSVPLKATSELGAGAIIAGTTLAISPDFTHTFVATNRALTPGANEGGGNLYIRNIATGAYTLVGTNSNPFSILGFVAVQNADKFQLGSRDFSWIVFRSEFPLIEGAPGNALYRWSVNGGLEVVSVLPDGEQAGVTTGDSDKFPAVRFVSDDGSRIYYTVPFGSEVGVFLREAGRAPRAISVSHIAGEPSTSVDARMLGSSADGRFAFFATTGAKLTGDGRGEYGDVYRYDAVGETLEYTGVTSQLGNFGGVLGIGDDGRTAYFQTTEGSKVWHDGAVRTVNSAPSAALGASALSPDGRFLAYETGSHDNNIPGDVYLYDAETDQSVCASCLPDGRPGEGYLRGGERYASNEVPQAVTDAGQVFFTSRDRLVAADVNGTSDVYAFQNGRPSLITPGNRNYEATFADISEDGSDVFFITNQKLVGQDNDETPDIYDARIGGGLAAQNPPPAQECLRDDCKATPNAGPELPFGGSEALSGPANVKAAAHPKQCRKGSVARKVKGKRRCVKKPKKAHGKKKAGKRTKSGRGGNR